MKKLAILFALTLCVALAGCNQPAQPQGSKPTQASSGTVSTPLVEGPAEPTPPAVGQVAMVYIGTKANGFTDYPIVYDGELTAEKLIQGITDLTGWDLTLAEDVISGKGGMSVCLSSKSSLFSSHCIFHFQNTSNKQVHTLRFLILVSFFDPPKI